MTRTSRAALVFLIVGVVDFSCSAIAQTANDQRQAEAAGTQIIQGLADRRFNELWDRQVSNWFKARVGRDAFLGGLTIGRSQLGDGQGSQLVSINYAGGTNDYQGAIYQMVFASKYSARNIYEQVVVINESGSWKLSGYNAAAQ